MQQYPFDIPTEAFPFEIFKQAFVAVQSCVVHLQVTCCGMDLGYYLYKYCSGTCFLYISFISSLLNEMLIICSAISIKCKKI